MPSTLRKADDGHTTNSNVWWATISIPVCCKIHKVFHSLDILHQYHLRLLRKLIFKNYRKFNFLICQELNKCSKYIHVENSHVWRYYKHFVLDTCFYEAINSLIRHLANYYIILTEFDFFVFLFLLVLYWERSQYRRYSGLVSLKFLL